MSDREDAPSLERAHPPERSLPGETDRDEALIQKVIGLLNSTMRRRGLETAIELGQIVLNAFFNGDPAIYRARERHHTSYRRLAEHPDLGMSHVTLWTSVAVVGQVASLPRDIAEALPLSHHRLLLAVKDGEEKARLARDAVAERLSKRELTERLRDASAPTTGSGARRGRRPLPGFVRIVNQLTAAAADAQKSDVNCDTIEHWGIARSRSAIQAGRDAVETILTHIAEAEAALDEAANGPEAPEQDAVTKPHPKDSQPVP